VSDVRATIQQKHVTYSQECGQAHRDGHVHGFPVQVLPAGPRFSRGPAEEDAAADKGEGGGENEQPEAPTPADGFEGEDDSSGCSVGTTGGSGSALFLLLALALLGMAVTRRETVKIRK